MANLLAASSSPYLRQHAENPVHWRPWGQAALDEAREHDKPLLISIGYSACHWCHVMAHESFEDAATAELMNRSFVCVKVDREERPDVDAIYMDACQQQTGQGGWPLHAFATPDGRPFFTGTYFPPQARHGLPSWQQVLEAIADAWTDRRDELEEQGSRLTTRLVGAAMLTAGDLPGETELGQAVDLLQRSFDSVNGGFGGAPKFPPSTMLGFLLRRGERSMTRYTLTSMASGGIFDHVAGGFARYAVDRTWTVPHFEKMLYDNALLGRRYAEAAHAYDEPAFGRVAERTLDWVLVDLADEDGALASALDADTDGVEGSTYVWTPEQLRETLGDEDAAVAARWLGVTPEGNFEDGATVLEARGEEPAPEQRDRILGALLDARSRRPQPGRDGKRIVSWNALAISGLATSGALLGRTDHTRAATRCAEAILSGARSADGRLLRLVPGPGEDPSGIPAGVLDDHAHLLEALVVLWETTFEPRWLEEAQALAGVIIRDFDDTRRGGFFTTAADGEQLVARRKDLDDTPLPSGQATAALAMLRLHALTGDAALLDAAEGVLRIGATLAVERPHGCGTLLSALDQLLAPPVEIAVVGDGPDADALVSAARKHAPASAVLAAGPAPSPGDADDEGPELLRGRDLVDGRPAAYVCRQMACRQPVTSAEALRAVLDETAV